MNRMKPMGTAKRSALGAAALASALSISPFLHAEPKAETEITVKMSNETKRNVGSAVLIAGGLVFIGLAVKAMRKAKDFNDQDR
ncbi:Uncharacterised protein [uncultured archaeon]|nr:Uncharacterised protein [uncultured archaeon]